MGKCTKQRYAYQNLARAAGWGIRHGHLDLRGYSAYQCKKCRYPDGRRAWHWGHPPRNGRRKQW